MNDTSNKVVAFVGRNFILPYHKRKYESFLKSLKSIAKNQEHFLLSLVRRAKDTDFGIRYNFSKISSVDDFRNNIPILDYKNLEPYLNRVAEGDVQALIPSDDQICAFASTTGSTGLPKRMPVTRSWLNTYQKWMQTWAVKALVDHPKIIGKRWLQITGPIDLDVTKTGHKVGMVSAIAMKYQKPIFQLFYATPRELSDLRNTDLRQYAISRLNMAYDVGFIMTITPNNLITLAEVGNRHKESIIKDIYDGTLQGFSEISSPLLKSKIAPLLKPQKKRALYLESLLKDHSELYPKHYWNTELITCWTGGTVGYKSQNLYRYYGDCPVRDIGYVSCEGRHTIPLAEGTPAGPLIPDGAFYEFIPLGSTKTKLAHELDIGQEYLILITTSNGLYRYKIDDIVCCRGYLEQTPVLEFIRKTSDYSDMEGEKLSAQQVISAVRDVANKHNVNILDFGFAGERRENLPPRYKIYLEPLNDVQIDPKALFQLAEDIDKHLISSNLCYCQKRSDGSLDSLNPVILPKGTWHKFMSSLSSKRKTGETQYKHPVILSLQQHAELQGLL